MEMLDYVVGWVAGVGTVITTGIVFWVFRTFAAEAIHNLLGRAVDTAIDKALDERDDRRQK